MALVKDMERVGVAAAHTPRPRAISAWALLLGALSVALPAAINPYFAFISRTWSVGSGSLLSSPLVVLFLFVLGNGIAARRWPGRALQRGELVVIYAMMTISVGLAMQGGLPYLASATTYPFYMARPEDGWQHSIWPNIPTRLTLGRLEPNAGFWEGIPEGAGLPRGAWLTPMLAWGSFTVALMAGMFCLGSLMSRDWIERQRLSFPLVDVPLAVTGEADRPTLRGSLFTNRAFWFGFALPAFFAILEWLHRIYPSVPALQLFQSEVRRYFVGRGLPWSALSGMQLSIVWPVIGIVCMLPAEVSLSLWLFYVLFLAQLLVWGALGIAESGGTSAVAINPRTFVNFEEAGGFIALSAAMVWQSRGAIQAAARALVGRGAEEPDPSGPLSWRWALLGFAGANAFLIWWAVKAGMQWWAFTALIGVFYAVLVGASRLVAAGGVMFVDTGAFPRAVVLRTLGASTVGVPTLTLFAYLSVIFMYDPMNLAMPQMMNSFKLLQSGRLEGRRWPLAALISVVVMLGVGIPALLWVIYHSGATSLSNWPFTDYPRWAFAELDASLRSPEGADNWLRLALGLGAVFTLVLVWLHTSFIWWPISPVGFLIASAYETNRSLWLSVFLGWGVAGLIRRYGGLKLYRTMRPAFLGLVLGQALTASVLAILSTALGLQQPPG